MVTTERKRFMDMEIEWIINRNECYGCSINYKYPYPKNEKVAFSYGI
ncbi:hypothetical protein SAMN05444673_6629 [Bacillus sp. OV166]|nr:hypothetical protein [Bacillus sp. OV166]SMQ86630.1 hypothetical protein SAMN05444673_6629 [Bacillus sp. OV166]